MAVSAGGFNPWRTRGPTNWPSLRGQTNGLINRIRSHISLKFDRPINKKPNRTFLSNPIARSTHPPKNPIAGPQKPGFFRNTLLQPTDSGKNPVSWIIARR
ncbi:hypothetical protein [Microcoleus sp. S13_B4]|uniref:hypothetical protein n=1 Tax=Microcoleus sp. S13_B4 TaxID=3055408 RepID=UPI002FCE901C